ncbi:hypothetical protein AX15_003009 [Amanita polypyramis BW_CC]|nr:hypothetical protein AX15_003009 [Amanita polypyramis BW_CC]
MLFLTCHSWLLLLFAAHASAGVHEIWWNITYVENASPDGLFSRRVIGVNGTWPPPPHDVQSNDTLIVHALNSLDVPTTLHHHGMYFNSTSWMDGALMVSQCGIPPGEEFDYVIPIDTSDQWGSYWVHAHASGQYVDGLRAPFIIHPPKEVHTYDEDYTVVLSDWYHHQHSTLLKQFINIANPRGAEPVPDSGLMYFTHNGQNLGPKAGTSPAGPTSAVGFNENATLPFQPGKTYRLRIINTSAFSSFYFWIDGHDMRIIEVDGTDVEEFPIDLIGVTVAQRYSVLVTARSDTTSNWVIHANMDVDMFDKVPPNLNPNITSSITYNTSAPLADPQTVDEYHNVNDTAIVPIVAIPQPVASGSIELVATFDTMNDGTNHAMFNNITYNSPLVPTVLSELTLGANATVAGAYGPLSFPIDHLQVIDIVLKNGDVGNHPFHLHGHKFMIVNRAQDYTSSDPELNPPLQEGQSNPIRRDTVLVPSMNSVTLRFVGDNPGAWFFHCHIEWHLEVGLAVQIIEAPLIAQQRSSSLPQKLIDQCRALKVPTSGNAAGHASATDLSGLKLGPYPQKLGWLPRGIGAMAGCVLSAVFGMGAVVWYALGGRISDEEIEHQIREKRAKKEKRNKFLKTLVPKRS